MITEKSKDMNVDKECFIVTPIGNETDPIRRHINGLIDASLIPILNEHGYKTSVSHRIFNPGSINKQVINKLYKSDLVVVNLTNLNPNVMYELAFRHTIRKPVITIAEKGTKLPFDIVLERTIFYENDFKGSIEVRENFKKAITAIEEEINEGKPVSNTIYDYLDKINVEESLVQHISPDKSDVVNIDVYKHILDRLDDIENKISGQNWQLNNNVNEYLSDPIDNGNEKLLKSRIIKVGANEELKELNHNGIIQSKGIFTSHNKKNIWEVR